MMDGGGGGGFNELMQQAAAMKTEQIKQDRRKFESQPTFLQHTLFQVRDDIIMGCRKEQDVEKRLEIALKYKEQGNELFKKGQLIEANDCYEKVLGCFWYIETSEPDFKTKGIKDEYLSYHDFEPNNEKVKELKVVALGNISAVQIAMQLWDRCIEACDFVLKMDKNNSKALYRRAQARTVPVSCGAAEMDLALRDLKLAVSADPKNKVVRKRYQELFGLRKKQNEKDKQTFTGLFERGDIVDDTNQDGKEEEEEVKDQEDNMTLDQKILFYKDMAHSLRSKRREEDAKEIDKIIQSLESAKTVQHLKPGKPLRITEEMIKDAKENHNLDLTDPLVQKELENLITGKTENVVNQSMNETTTTASSKSNNIVFYAVLFSVFSVFISRIYYLNFE